MLGRWLRGRHESAVPSSESEKPYDIDAITAVVLEARQLIALPESDFGWSTWDTQESALAEIDQTLERLHGGDLDAIQHLRVLFAPTSAIQEVSISSGWGHHFLKVAERFDALVEP